MTDPRAQAEAHIDATFTQLTNWTPMTDNHTGRSTRRYRSLRTAFRTNCAYNELPCWLCGRPINYDLPREHPEAFNLDHAVPVSQNIDLAEDPANFRPSHASCNQRRGNDRPHQDIPIGIPSESW
jgi:hypothetical protein